MKHLKISDKNLYIFIGYLFLAISILGCNGVSKKSMGGKTIDRQSKEWHIFFKNDFYLLKQKDGEMYTVDNLLGKELNNHINDETGVITSATIGLQGDEKWESRLYSLEASINGNIESSRTTTSVIPLTLDYWIYSDSISEISIDFGISGKFQKRDIVSQRFEGVKWGEKVAFVVNGVDYLLLVITQPILQKTEEIK
ncbi:MAG: hypothetical protein HY762_02070 [Planctomycetes bacterium]|nr:hypothetical protein [Planctomycetota bacterium]